MFRRNSTSVYIIPIESTVSPLEIPLPNGGDTFWLDGYTVGHVVANSDKTKGHDIFAIDVKFTSEGICSNALESPVHVGSFPPGVVPRNFRHAKAAGRLVFSAYVHDDGDISTVKQQDEVFEKRGNTALVYDEMYERHWDKWTDLKRSTLFSVSLAKDQESSWKLGNDYLSPLKGTKHVRPTSETVESITKMKCRKSQLSPSVDSRTLIFRTIRLSIQPKIQTFHPRGIQGRMLVAQSLGMYMSMHCD